MSNKSGELINYPAGNLLAHFKRYFGRYTSEITVVWDEHAPLLGTRNSLHVRNPTHTSKHRLGSCLMLYVLE